MKNDLVGFNVGCEFQVAYQVGGTSNILKVRRGGKILGRGLNRKGNGYVFTSYVDGSKGHRIATLSVAKMINPIVFN